MNYIVHWTDAALDELAAVWLAAADRNAVTAASHQLELEIATDPAGRGLPRRAAPGYIAVELPLCIEYEVIEDDKTVRVLHVWSIV
jgi:hypothetical protein